mmetsp:Transcript_40972/g.49204  ORF Transcript_40972/g.49204 Transcript_40972/m.49204 type:complete len:87 (-) Transcript_40972:493-753(-)
MLNLRKFCIWVARGFIRCSVSKEGRKRFSLESRSVTDLDFFASTSSRLSSKIFISLDFFCTNEFDSLTMFLKQGRSTIAHSTLSSH